MTRRRRGGAAPQMREYLGARGLDAGAAAARGFAETTWKGRWPALRLPYHDLDGEPRWEGDQQFARFRLFPDLATGAARSLAPPDAKFVQPAGTENHLYLDPTVPWHDVLGASQAEVWLTEGEVKAASACAHGIPCVGVGGVWSWRSKARRGPIPELVEVFAGRRGLTVVLAFDADVAVKPDVRVAMRALADELRRLGVRTVQAATLPDLGDGVTGLDDVLAARGAEAVRSLEREDVVPDPAVDELLGRYVFAHQVKRFIDLETLQQYDKETFNDTNLQRFTGAQDNPKAAPTFLRHPDARVVDRPTYAPGRRDPVLEEHGETCVNLWRPGEVSPRHGDPTPWLEHVAWVVPDEGPREHLLDWLAFQVQQPGEKCNWAVFLGGAPGCGKDTLFQPVLEGVGERNYRTIGPDDLASGYTDWLERAQLVVLNEMMNFERRELSNRLKPLVASPPTKLRINAKFLPQYEIPNRVNFIFMSNDEKALSLSQDDRRFFVYWSPIGKAEAERAVADGWFEELHAWLQANAGVVLNWLLDREIGETFNPKGRAPWTESKREMVEASRSPLEAYLAEAIADHAEPCRGDLVEIRGVVEGLPDRLHPNPNNVREALRNLGAERIHDGRQIGLPVSRWDREQHKVRLWAVRNGEEYNRMTHTQLVQAWLRQQDDGSVNEPKF